MSFHAPIFQFAVASMRVPSRLDIKDMNQKLPDKKLNRDSSNTFEIHVKVPKGGELNLKLDPKVWRQISNQLKNPSFWLLLTISCGSMLSSHIQTPSNPPTIQQNQ
jgi:hypothetical protein